MIMHHTEQAGLAVSYKTRIERTVRISPILTEDFLFFLSSLQADDELVLRFDWSIIPEITNPAHYPTACIVSQ
jgi:hypothetical protein